MRIKDGGHRDTFIVGTRIYTTYLLWARLLISKCSTRYYDAVGYSTIIAHSNHSPRATKPFFSHLSPFIIPCI